MEPYRSKAEDPATLHLDVVDLSSTPDAGTRLREAAELLDRSIGPDLSDDRFDDAERTEPGSMMAMAREPSGRVVAVASSAISRGRLQIDVVADTDDIANHGAEGSGPVALGRQLVAATISEVRWPLSSADDLVLELWGRPHRPWHDQLAADMGLSAHRSLHQMRCPLPRPDGAPPAVQTRDLDPERDAFHVGAVNNRAFAAHPDQSNQEVDGLLATFTAPAFDPASVRLLDPAPGDDRAEAHPLAGFCWTKKHPERPGRTAMGEIYVIAVDPAYHGEGLGTALTAAGLDWLADQGLRTGMLYVESDNEPAIRAYTKLGFVIHRTDTAWRRPDSTDGDRP